MQSCGNKDEDEQPDLSDVSKEVEGEQFPPPDCFVNPKFYLGKYCTTKWYSAYNSTSADIIYTQK